jgi:UDP-N-acetyl-2-amino-2-deoxyglucuronate dehydrogenase
MNNKLTYGIIGCGSFGCTHIESLLTIAGAEITALCDKHIEKCYEAKEKYSLSADCYENYEDMLNAKKFDIVVVATSDKEHAPISIMALDKGNHVMSEKPMSLFLEDCKAMIDAAKRNDKLLMVGQVCRFTPAFIKAILSLF